MEKFKQSSINSWRNTNSPIVVFPCPSEKIEIKWQLASKENISHIITLPHLTREKIAEAAKEVSGDLNKNKKEGNKIMKQIVVVSGNQIGVIADISRILSENKINIERLDTSGSKPHGAVILTTDNYDKALKILNNARFKAVSEDALVVRLENKPGSLAEISGKLKDTGINIRSMHIIQKGEEFSLVAIATE